jgi:hypothetical protein
MLESLQVAINLHCSLPLLNLIVLYCGSGFLTKCNIFLTFKLASIISMLLHNIRKSTWRFKANWTVPAHLIGNQFSKPKGVLDELESEISRDLLERQSMPRFLANIELRYSVADWELTNIPMVLSVDGYIQSDRGHSVDHDNVDRWIPADWIPVENQLRWDPTYKRWSEFTPAFQHVQVYGEPAVARGGPNKKDGKVLCAAFM